MLVHLRGHEKLRKDRCICDGALVVQLWSSLSAGREVFRSFTLGRSAYLLPLLDALDFAALHVHYESFYCTA